MRCDMGRKMKDSGVEWIGAIPEEWDIERLKYQFDFGKGLAITKADLVEDGIGVISYGQIHAKSNMGTALNDSLIRYIPKDSEAITKSSLLHKGDFVFADTSEDLDGCGNCVYIDEEKEIYAGYHTIILRNKKSNGKYLAYLFQTDNWRKQIRSKVSGVKVFSISKKILSEAINIIPPIEMQNKIVELLDAKCSAIDVAIEKANDSIVAYKSLKQSLITRAVTKGVRGKREMKGSGSQWFGEIPEKWQMMRIKYLFHIQKDIAGEEGYTVLSITQRGIKIKDLSKNEGQLAANYSNYQLVHKGDFAMNHMDLLTGWVDISEFEGVTSPDYRVFVLDDKLQNYDRYYLYMMQMCYTNRIFYGLGQGVSGLGRWRLQADKFLNFEVPVPPKNEQREIAAYLDKKCTAIDNLIAKKEQLLTELEAYKKSLIYEYVTGKREILE